jgi:putative PIN family toxin of toxin-antitoxin system
MTTERVVVVLDSSVWISALLHSGNPGRIVSLAASGKIAIYVSPSIRAEVLAVLSRRKFGLSRAQTTLLAQVLDEVASLIEPRERLPGVVSDPHDEHVIEAAAAAGARYLVTGDKRHLLPLVEFRGIRIVSPRQFLDEWTAPP